MIKSVGLGICRSLRQFAGAEGGATAIEYALIAGGISIAIAATVVSLGASVKGFYSSVATAMK
jgi:pilus assembly protein Flp/PilA